MRGSTTLTDMGKNWMWPFLMWQQRGTFSIYDVEASDWNKICFLMRRQGQGTQKRWRVIDNLQHFLCKTCEGRGGCVPYQMQ